MLANCLGKGCEMGMRNEHGVLLGATLNWEPPYWIMGQPCWPIGEARGLRIEHSGPRKGGVHPPPSIRMMMRT